MGNLEDKISMDNPIRFVDAFISFIYFKKEIFDLKTLKTQGRPSFQIEVFLKIYIYGYINGIRCLQKLSKEDY